MQVKIGIAGTGRMGAAIATRLLKLGREVSVWNRTAAKAEPLVAAGARFAATPEALANGADIVISLLTNAAAISATYQGPQGLLAGKVAGKLFVEMSTVRPEIQTGLAAAVAARGAALIDCPVGGTVGPALDGKLFGFAGGTAEDVARARPVLDQICRRIEHLGAIGAGSRMKLAINLPLLVYWQAVGEAMLLCKPLGLAPARMVDIFSDTSGGPNVLKTRGPMLAAALGGQRIDPVTFDIDSIRKDLQTMIEEGHALGSELPVAAQALACFDEAASQGLGGEDAVALPVRWLSRPDANR